jgi:transaldolase
MASHGSTNAMQSLLALGQSVWLDFLSRDLLRSGKLASLIDDGLRGLTSNPTIFEHAIAKGAHYDDALASASPSADDRKVFETVAVADVQGAADLFAPVYEASAGADGFVSLEVSPDLARDTAGTLNEARRLWKEVDRPNLMIKVPGTAEGWPAIRQLLTEGLNINITLLFAVDHYQRVAEAYQAALEARLAAGNPIDRIASVASFFVSRVDTEVDERIDVKGGALEQFKGKAAIANAQVAYEWLAQYRAAPRWKHLAEHGARPQRLLWASTSTKDPAYSDVLYVESLIGPDTVNTMPPATLEAFEDHGKARRTLSDDATEARATLDRLAKGGIDLEDVTNVLEAEGIEKFAASFRSLLETIGKKRGALAR